MKLRIFSLLLLFAAGAQAQDTIRFLDGVEKISANAKSRYFDTTHVVSPSTAFMLLQQNGNGVHHGLPNNFGPVQKKIWTSFIFKNEGHERDFLIQVRSVHVQSIHAFLLKNEKFTSAWVTGANLPFTQRPLPHRYFLFPVRLEASESVSFLLMVDQVNGLELPLFIWEKEAFLQLDYKLNLMWGGCFGFLTLAMILSFASLVIFRQKLFLWYSLYISSSLLYSMTDQGYSFQFIYPFAANFDPPFSIHTALYSFLFLIKFSQSLLDTKFHLPGVHRYLNAVFWFFVVMIIQDFIFREAVRQFSYYYLPMIYLVLIMGLGLLACAGINSLKRTKKVALLFLSAYGIIIITSLIGILIGEYGMGSNIGVNPVVPGYLAEVLILSIAVVIQFRDLQKEKLLLTKQVVSEQKKSYQSFIRGIEKERSRIAGELHDDIGSRLSLIKNSVNKIGIPGQKLNQDLQEIIDSVRNLSHELSPPIAKVGSLLPLVERLVKEARQSSSIDIKLQAHGFEEKLQPHQIQHTYRILQEAIQNIIKHSKATHADIQLFGYETELVITIEDDGIGFDQEALENGLGLNQIKVRVESLGGRFEINSAHGKGCHLLVYIPLM